MVLSEWMSKLGEAEFVLLGKSHYMRECIVFLLGKPGTQFQTIQRRQGRNATFLRGRPLIGAGMTEDLCGARISAMTGGVVLQGAVCVRLRLIATGALALGLENAPVRRYPQWATPVPHVRLE